MSKTRKKRPKKVQVKLITRKPHPVHARTTEAAVIADGQCIAMTHVAMTLASDAYRPDYVKREFGRQLVRFFRVTGLDPDAVVEGTVLPANWQDVDWLSYEELRKLLLKFDLIGVGENGWHKWVKARTVRYVQEQEGVEEPDSKRRRRSRMAKKTFVEEELDEEEYEEEEEELEEDEEEEEYEEEDEEEEDEEEEDEEEEDEEDEEDEDESDLLDELGDLEEEVEVVETKKKKKPAAKTTAKKGSGKKAKAKEPEFDYDVKSLAKELKIEPRTLRAYLRREFPREDDGKNTRYGWNEGSKALTKIKKHFAKATKPKPKAKKPAEKPATKKATPKKKAAPAKKPAAKKAKSKK